MIELLLQAERAARDRSPATWPSACTGRPSMPTPRTRSPSSGLAKVARLRGDDRTAIAFGRRALKVDAENAVAQRLVAELESAHPAPGSSPGRLRPRWQRLRPR